MKRIAFLTGLLAAAPAVAGNIEPISSGAFEGQDLPFSEAVAVGNLVFLSGQIGVKPGTLELAGDTMEAQARQTMENIGATLKAAGLTFKDIAKCTVMLSDMAEWPTFNAVYTEYFEKPYPARSAFGASGLALGGKLEVECIAVR